MHSALKKEFSNLKALALKKSVPIAVIETQLEHVAFVSSGKKLICLVIEEEEIHNMLSCFKVNLTKWEWAETEGFSLEDGIPRDVADVILIRFSTPKEYLNYLGL